MMTSNAIRFVYTTTQALKYINASILASAPLLQAWSVIDLDVPELVHSAETLVLKAILEKLDDIVTLLEDIRDNTRSTI